MGWIVRADAHLRKSVQAVPQQVESLEAAGGAGLRQRLLQT